jgi:hypothetical protein
MHLDHAELRGEHETFDSFAYISKATSKELESFEVKDDGIQDFDSFAFASRAKIWECAQKYVKYLGYHPVDIIRKTLENTTQLATTILEFPMHRHIRAKFPWLNCNWFCETVATDTYFANVRAIGGTTCAQVFYGVQSHMINVNGMKTESKMPKAYKTSFERRVHLKFFIMTTLRSGWERE